MFSYYLHDSFLWPRLTTSDSTLFIFIQRRDVYGAWEQYLGLEHSDNTPKRAYAASQVMLSRYICVCYYSLQSFAKMSEGGISLWALDSCLIWFDVWVIAEPSHIWKAC